MYVIAKKVLTAIFIPLCAITNSIHDVHADGLLCVKGFFFFSPPISRYYYFYPRNKIPGSASYYISKKNIRKYRQNSPEKFPKIEQS